MQRSKVIVLGQDMAQRQTLHSSLPGIHGSVPNTVTTGFTPEAPAS